MEDSAANRLAASQSVAHMSPASLGLSAYQKARIERKLPCSVVLSGDGDGCCQRGGGDFKGGARRLLLRRCAGHAQAAIPLPGSIAALAFLLDAPSVDLAIGSCGRISPSNLEVKHRCKISWPNLAINKCHRKA